ncbi:MAG: DUF3572 domain-containing protein [Rhizobiaceae bacterium]
MNQLSKNAAESIAVSGLQRLASDDDLLLRFCNLTGILANEMRDAASQPHFLVGVLDFYLAYEPDLLAWAEADGMSPESVVAARHVLAPEDRSGFE